MADEKSINDQINEIVERQYNGYRGRLHKRLGLVHYEMRVLFGDTMFLSYLEKRERDNPKPVYHVQTEKN